MKQKEKIYSLKNAAPGLKVSASTNLNPHAIFFRKPPEIDEKICHQKYHMKGVQMHNICKQ